MKRLLKNVASLMLSQAVGKAINFVLLAYLARNISVEQFGSLTLALGVASFVLIASDLGNDTLAIRYMAQEKFEPVTYLRGLGPAKLILTVVCLLVMGVSYPLFSHSNPSLVIWMILISSGITSVAKFLRTPFYAWQRMEVDALILGSEKLLLAALAVPFIISGGGFFGYGVALLISSIAGLIASVWVIRKELFKRVWEDSLNAIGFMREAFPIGLNALFVLIYYRIDTFFIAHYHGDYEVGIYGTAYLLMFGLMTLASSITQSFFPVIAKIHGTPEMYRLVNVTLKYMFVFGLPVTMLLGIHSTFLSELIFGRGYIEAGAVFSILVYQFMFVLMTPVFGNVLRAGGAQRVMAIATGFGALLNVALNFLWVPEHGIAGAAYATLASEVLVFLFAGYMVLRNTLQYSTGVFRAGLAVSLSASTFYWLSTNNVEFGIVTPSLAFVLVYFTSVFALGCLKPSEIHDLRKAIA